MTTTHFYFNPLNIARIPSLTMLIFFIAMLMLLISMFMLLSHTLHVENNSILYFVMSEHTIELVSEKHREKIEQHLSKYVDISMPIWIISYIWLTKVQALSKGLSSINFAGKLLAITLQLWSSVDPILSRQQPIFQCDQRLRQHVISIFTHS